MDPHLHVTPGETAAAGRSLLGIGAKWWTLAVVGASTFMSALDGSIVNIALPAIGKATGSPVSTLEWVVLIYLITVSSSLLVFGRLADIYGRKRIYSLGQIIFVLGSLLCGLSGRIHLLIAARCIQGVGGAMVFALSPAVLIGAFGARERGRALGMQSTMTYLGLTVGPGLGGLLTQHFGWPAIFYVNLPVGAVAIALSTRVLRQDEAGERQPFDLAGAALMAVTLSTFLLGLTQGPDAGWGSPLIVGLLVVAAIAGGAFVRVERTVAAPALDFRLFADRAFSASILAAYLNYTSTSAVGFLFPFLLVRAAGFTASHAGMVLMATPVTMMLVTAPSGYLSDRIGVRLPTAVGMAVMACGAFLGSRLGAGATSAQVLPCAVLMGLGAGLFNAPNNSAIMGSAPADRRGVAGALLAAARTTGFASGVALAGVLFTHHAHSLAHLPERLATAQAIHPAFMTVAAICAAGAALSAVRKHGGASTR